MEWINLSVKELASADYRRSSMIDRGTWLTLLGYCVQQENSGRLVGVKGWSAWDCQQVLGIEKASIDGEHHLWEYDGDDLVVHGYPVAKQQEVAAKRKAARKGNRIRWGNDSHSDSQSDSDSESGKEGEREGNGKEKQKGKAPRGGFVPPTAAQWFEYAKQHEPSWPETDAQSAFDHYVGCGWKMGEGRGKPVVDWQACVRTCVARWRKNNRGGAGGPPRDNPTGALEVFEPEAPAKKTGGAT